MGIEWVSDLAKVWKWRRRGSARRGPAAGGGRGLEVSDRVFGLWHRLIGCPNARFRQGFPVARVWAEELGRDEGECVPMGVMKYL